MRFPGQYYDEETGLHYNWNRYYDPSTGRYITPDPIGLAGGLNLYLYAGGNPVNRIDPMGLESYVDGGEWAGLQNCEESQPGLPRPIAACEQRQP